MAEAITVSLDVYLWYVVASRECETSWPSPPSMAPWKQQRTIGTPPQLVTQRYNDHSEVNHRTRSLNGTDDQISPQNSGSNLHTHFIADRNQRFVSPDIADEWWNYITCETLAFTLVKCCGEQSQADRTIGKAVMALLF